MSQRYKPFRQFINEVRVEGKNIDATKFESDLVAALNGDTGSASYQNPVSQRIAQTAAQTLRADGVRGNARRNSGGGGRKNLTPIYIEHGVISGEPKTDIIVGTYRYSMKYGRAAQIAAAQAAECKAVFAAAFDDHPRYKQLVEQQILPLIGSVMDKKNFYRIRKKFNRKDLAAFGNQLSRLLSFHSAQSTLTKKEASEFLSFLNTVGVVVPTKASIGSFLNQPATKQILFHEFVSGKKRFVDTTNSPTHMLAWFETGEIKHSPVSTFVRTHLDQFEYSIRDRGDGRGAAGRVGISETYAPISIDQIESWVDAKAAILTEELLHEGFFSSVKDTLVDAATAVWSLLVNIVKKIMQFIVSLYQRGLTALMEFFGLEPTGMTWTWTS